MAFTEGGLRNAGMVAFALVALAGCNGGSDPVFDPNTKPTGVGTVTKTSYDGASDDLLTAGLGKTGLGTGACPSNATPAAADLRRIAICNNYRALVDVSANGGYGTLYGPNIDTAGNPTLGEGKVAGNEYLAYFDDGTGKKNVTLMVQVPTGWNRDRPCIVTATSSGSRGVYGAIATAGEWGLKRKCAVAYTDKGTGSGVHDLATNTVNLQNGVRADANVAGTSANFNAGLSGSDLSSYNSAYPNRIAVKHAMSQQNPEKDWGANTLTAIRFAIYVLNEERGDRNGDGSTIRVYTAANTLVIASSVSNGGASAVAAAEQDTEGLIDGVAVAEPVLELNAVPGLTIKRGSTTQGSGRPLYDYFTLANLYQPCAALSTRAANSYGIAAVLPVPAFATNRCTALRANGLLTSTTTAAQAEEALDTLIAAGWQPESNLIHATHFTQAVPPVTTSYAYAYGRFSVKDNMCGLTFAGTDAAGKPAALASASLAQIFGTGNGVPPTSGIQIINNNSVGGPVNNVISVSASTGVQDYGFDTALCMRKLWTGSDAGATSVKAGVAETLRSGNLRGKPAIIVAGRADALVPVNFNARPYYGLNKITEGAASKLSYIEVLNGQHFDAFIDNAALPGYDTAFIPLHVYFIRAMDSMYNYLTANVPLPPSQVVRTTPRGGTPGAAPAITAANVPPIAASPASGDQITFSANTVQVPD